LKYFIVNGYRPNPVPPKKTKYGYSESHLSGPDEKETIKKRAKQFEKAGHKPPAFGETKFFKDNKYGRISIFVYDVYRTVLLIVSRSQRKAYYLGNSIRAILSTIFGQAPAEGLYAFLIELNEKPDFKMDLYGIAHLIRPLKKEDKYENVELINNVLLRGTGLSQHQLEKACIILVKAIDKPQVLYAIQLLEYSYSQVYGFMVGSYYEAHYSRDRKELSRYRLDSIYLENRIAYDTAFVTAFRGIEALLEKPYFRKNEIKRLLTKVDSKHRTNFTTKKYRSFHEMFSSRKRLWLYEDIIKYYLELRNAVAAHGNINPPKIIMEDQVFEIQMLLKSMFMEILYPEE
jgi:hypothetical protein